MATKQNSIEALDEKTIEQKWSPEEIAVRAINAAGLSELAPRVKQTIASAAQEHENVSNIAPHTKYTASAFFSEVSTAIEHNPKSARFSIIAKHAIEGRMETAEYAPKQAAVLTAAELGRGLARLVSESEPAFATDGQVAPPELEGDKIDVVTGAKEKIQVQTCFAGSDETTGKSAKEKFNSEIPEKVDYYVVLHFDTRTDSKKFGVAVNDLSTGMEYEGKYSQGWHAKNAQE